MIRFILILACGTLFSLSPPRLTAQNDPASVKREAVKNMTAGRFGEAITLLDRYLRLKPEDAQAHNNLGNALAEQGKVEEAIANYQAALRLNADNPEAHFNLALALLRQGRRQDALGHLNNALRLKPDYADARRQLQALAASK